MVNKIRNYFLDARQEFRHVNWPTRQEAIRLTSIVIGLSVGLAIFLGVFDMLAEYGLKYLLGIY